MRPAVLGALVAIACAIAGASCSVVETRSADRTPALEAIVRGGGEGPVLVLLHGYGSRPEHVESFAARTDLPAGIRVVLPRAPLPIAGADGRMWWPLPADLSDLRRSPMPGMASARARIASFLDALEARLGVPSERIVLGGFSQGAILSLDLALHDARPLAGLVLMSGTLADDAWLPRLASRRGTPIYVSHGTRDDVLRFELASELVARMRERGLDVRFRTFEGGHVVTPEVSEDVASFVTEVTR